MTKTFEVWTTQGTHHLVSADFFRAELGWVVFYRGVPVDVCNPTGEALRHDEVQRFNTDHTLFVKPVVGDVMTFSGGR